MTAYAGRFAPSPTGPLHFGSLVAALASWLDARSSGGSWLVRIEDLDPPREQPGAADAILRQLEACGLHWDGAVVAQSTRGTHYREALARLERSAWAYWCGCSRKEIADSATRFGRAREPAIAEERALVYPGTCRAGLAPGKSARALRLRTLAAPIRFTDRLQGQIEQSVEREVGDFVLLRADGFFAYQLAVVVDDAAQGITDVVRGADLLDSTVRQIHLQRLLGLPTPRYLHVPVATSASGEKISKQTRAPDAGPAELARALRFLGLRPPARLADAALLAWARQEWSVAKLPRARALPASVAG